MLLARLPLTISYSPFFQPHAFTTVGLDRVIITLPPIYLLPINFHRLGGDRRPNPCPQFSILASGFIPNRFGKGGSLPQAPSSYVFSQSFLLSFTITCSFIPSFFTILFMAVFAAHNPKDTSVFVGPHTYSGNRAHNLIRDPRTLRRIRILAQTHTGRRTPLLCRNGYIFELLVL